MRLPRRLSALLVAGVVVLPAAPYRLDFDHGHFGLSLAVAAAQNGNGNAGGDANGNGQGNGNGPGNGNGNGGGGNANGGGNGSGNGNGNGNSDASSGTAAVNQGVPNGQGFARGGVVSPSLPSVNITVRHRDGMTERIEDGRYEMMDASGRTIINRGATWSDLSRLGG